MSKDPLIDHIDIHSRFDWEEDPNKQWHHTAYCDDGIDDDQDVADFAIAIALIFSVTVIVIGALVWWLW